MHETEFFSPKNRGQFFLNPKKECLQYSETLGRYRFFRDLRRTACWKKVQHNETLQGNSNVTFDVPRSKILRFQLGSCWRNFPRCFSAQNCNLGSHQHMFAFIIPLPLVNKHDNGWKVTFFLMGKLTMNDHFP